MSTLSAAVDSKPRTTVEEVAEQTVNEERYDSTSVGRLIFSEQSVTPRPPPNPPASLSLPKPADAARDDGLCAAWTRAEAEEKGRQDLRQQCRSLRLERQHWRLRMSSLAVTQAVVLLSCGQNNFVRRIPPHKCPVSFLLLTMIRLSYPVGFAVAVLFCALLQPTPTPLRLEHDPLVSSKPKDRRLPPPAPSQRRLIRFFLPVRWSSSS